MDDNIYIVESFYYNGTLKDEIGYFSTPDAAEKAAEKYIKKERYESETEIRYDCGIRIHKRKMDTYLCN